MIYNPRSSYWDPDDEQDTINHEDAELLHDPEEIVDRFSTFLDTLLDVIKEKT